MAQPSKPGPLLQALLDSGIAYLSEYGNYLAVASDGIEIVLSGPLYEDSDADHAERYLNDHPTEETW